MKKNKTLILITLSMVLSVFMLTSCRDAVKEPSPIGPSTFAVLLYLNANPNVLSASMAERPQTTITATLKKYDGTALAGRTLYFEIVDNLGAKLDLGYFEGNIGVKRLETDGSGTVSVIYYGPLASEIAANGTIYVRATLSGEGSEFISEKASLYIIRNAD
jgi:hypothetical protein